MKTLLSVIRWKFVVPVGLFVGAMILFFVMFFDPLMARAIEKIGSSANGAKVEVTGLKTRFFKGLLTIQRLQVTNKEAPMQNLVDAGPLTFQMNPFELLKKKVVINESTLSGLQFNTARKTSGALPRVARKQEQETPSAAARLYGKYKDRFTVSLQGLTAEAKGKIEFDRDDLTIVKESREIQERAESLPEDFKGRVDQLNAEERLKKAEADLKGIRNTPTQGSEAITAIPEALGKLKQVKADLDQLKGDIQSTRDSIVEDTRRLKNDSSNLSMAKQRDMDALMSRFNLDFADPERLMQAVVGPVVLERFQTVFNYVQLARRHMPSQKEKEVAKKRERSKGVDVVFPSPAALPRFWLMKGGIDGKFQDIDFSGYLAHLTSDPQRVGKPFTVGLQGKTGAQVLTGNVIMNHTGPTATDSVGIKATGVDFVKAAGQGPLGKALEKGTGSAELAFSLIGDDQIGGAVKVALSGIKLNKAELGSSLGLTGGAGQGEAIKTKFLDNMVSAMEKLPVLAVEGQLTGTWNDPGLILSSNLTSVFAGVVKDSVGSLVRDQKAQLEARLNSVLAEERQKVDGKIANVQKDVNDRLAAIEAQVQKEIQDAAGINLGSGQILPGVKTPSLDKLFKK